MSDGKDLFLKRQKVLADFGDFAVQSEASIGAESWPPIGMGPPGRTQIRRPIDRGPGVVLFELNEAQIAERRVEPPGVVDVVDELQTVLDDVIEDLESHRVDPPALALSYGLPRRPVELTRPWASSSSR